MKNPRLSGKTIFLSLMLVSSTSLLYAQGSTDPKQSTIDVQQERPVIESLNKQYSNYLLEGDSVAIAAMYAKNGKIGGKKGPEILSAIGHWIRSSIKNDSRHVTFTTVTLNADSDLLVETGKAEGRNEQGELKYTFRYLVVWKKEDDVWKLYRDVPL